MLKKLPLGLQDFRGIIQDGYKYVDKTRIIHQMANSGKYFFLSRPRRFGKSVTVSTLHELYSGNRELFQGWWIEDHWDWNKKHPTLQINLTVIGFVETGLETALHFLLDRLIQENGLLPAQGPTRWTGSIWSASRPIPYWRWSRSFIWRTARRWSMPTATIGTTTAG